MDDTEKKNPKYIFTALTQNKQTNKQENANWELFIKSVGLGARAEGWR